MSCAPVNNISKKIEKIPDNKILDQKSSSKKTLIINESTDYKTQTNKNFNVNIQNTITIILSKKDNQNIVNQFINTVELAVYQKKLTNISFDIKIYNDKSDLDSILKESQLLGNVFIGPLNTSDTELLDGYCSKGVIFFSFSSNKNLAKDCVYLVNFFPQNELRTIFKSLPKNSKVALLYPENKYGFGINSIIDDIANQSESIIVNRASYNVNLSSAPAAIKELGKFELRKYELNRQKKILANKKDAKSKRRLIKIEKFQTIQDFDFTHVIIADYGLRLLQVAPLLPYYDIDPNIVQFVGTGAWDDEVFYDEPSLRGAIYPGIEFENRRHLVEDFYNIYNEKFLRTSTLPYDLVGLLSFVIEGNYTLTNFYDLLNKSNIKFSGVDGSFYFLKNVIERDLDILSITDGRAIKVLK